MLSKLVQRLSAAGIRVELEREAKNKLSLVGHLQRDPELLQSFLPAKDALFGLVLHSLTEAGKQKLINWPVLIFRCRMGI